MKKLFFFAALTLYSIICHSVYSQNIMWDSYYNGPSDEYDISKSMTVDANGNVYVTGYSEGYPAYCVTIKYNSSGVQQWASTFADEGAEYNVNTYAVLVDESGNVYVGGNFGVNSSEPVMLLIKYNYQGTEQWHRTYVNSSFLGAQGRAMALDSYGNVYIAGISADGVTYATQTLKYNSSGTLLWEQNTTPEYADYPTAIGFDKYGNVYTIGDCFRDPVEPPLIDYMLIKYNSSGLQQWIRYFDADDHLDQSSAGVVGYEDGSVYVTGTAVINGLQPISTVKYDIDGNVVWSSAWYGSDWRYLNRSTAITLKKISCTSKEDIPCWTYEVYLTGYTDYTTVGIPGPDLEFCDAVTLKYNPAGELQWDEVYDNGNGYFDFPIAIKEKNGNVYITGDFHSDANSSDIVTLKYNSSGVQQWAETQPVNHSYPTASQIPITSLYVDNNEFIYISGTDASDGADFVTVKYCATTLCPDERPLINVPLTQILSQNYPNPFNPVTKINFTIPKAGNVKVTVYDVAGHEVETLVNSFLQEGEHNVTWNGINFASGVYFYRITIGDFTDTKKLILAK